jgi:hypothetical protein
MWVDGQRHATAALPPGKTRYPLYSRQGGLQGCSERVRKISPTLGFDPRSVQPAVGRYSDYAERFNMFIGLFGVCTFVQWVM